MNPDPSTVLPKGAMPTAGALANPASTYSGITPVPNASIQPATPITMPQSQALTPVDANAYGMLLGNQATMAQQQAQQAEADYSAESQKNQSLSDLLLGREAFAQQQAQEQNLPELQKQARDLRSTSMLQTAQYIQGIRNIDQKNVAQGERNTAQIEAQRQNAIDSLLTNAQLSFIEGNIQTAQANIKTAVDLKYNAIEQRIANSDKVLERLGNLANRADAKAVQAAKDRNDYLKEQIAQKKADDEAMQTLILNAQVQQAPPATVSKAQALFKAGKSKMEVAAALGPYAGDYWGTRVKIAQINKLDAEAEETRAKVTAAGGVGSTSQANTKDQAKFLLDTIAQAKNLSDASGQAYLRRKAGEVFTSSTEFNRLQNQVATLKTNLLTMATDPNIKKFFGPQMTEADVRNMQAAGTTLNPEAQTPAELKAELERAQKIFEKFVPGYVAPVPVKQSASSWAQSIQSALLNPSQGGNYGYQDNTQ